MKKADIENFYRVIGDNLVPLKKSARNPLSFNFIEWKAGNCRHEQNKDTFVFADRSEITREMLMDYEFQLEVKRAQDYWDDLPWYKKLFASKPIRAH